MWHLRCQSTGSCAAAGCWTSAAAPKSFRCQGTPRAASRCTLPRHGVLLTGDIVANVGAVMLDAVNQNRALAMQSFRRAAALNVDVACFGHGEPLTSGAGQLLREAVQAI
jgi:hypothetical protein